MRVSSRRSLCILVPALLALILAGCGGGSGGQSEPEPKPINRAPSVSIIQPDHNPYPLDVTSAQYLDITVKVEDPDGDKLACVWTWDAGSITPAEGTLDAGTQMTARFTPPDFDGSCTLTVSVSDGEANASDSLEVQVAGWNVQPGTQLRILSVSMSPDPAAPSATASLSALVDNPGGKPLTYSWETKHGSISGTGSTVTWTTPSTAGIYGIYISVTDGANSATAGKVVTVAGAEGGLLGKYFTTDRYNNVVQLRELRVSRIDPTVNFFWEKLSPAPDKLSGDEWGARWTGFVKCESPGTYTFRVHVDDGTRMRIRNDAGQWIYVIPNDPDNWRDHTEGAWLPAAPIPVQLDGGNWYPIELEYFEDHGDAFISLFWSVNGGPETVIPQECLKPPTAP